MTRPSTLTSSELLTVGELAARLKVQPSWVYGHADDLGVYRLGKYLRFSWERVLSHLESDGRSGSLVGAAAQRPPARPTRT